MSSSFVAANGAETRTTATHWWEPIRAEAAWRAAAVALLSVRFIQGFIYWGGGSRRFIYAPAKLNPDATNWMANKFQTAMPGALLGTDHLIAYLLQHFWLLYPAVILFSAAELVAGLMLMTGLMTRGAALASVGFSVMLMLMFGWQGATCIDEWTMAASNLAMGATLALAGSGTYSLDNVLLRHFPALAEKGWFRWLGGALPLPMSGVAFRNAALAVLAATVVFNVATYDHYRGSVYSAFHSGPVSPSKHHITLNDVALLPDGAVSVHAYLDGGTPEAASHIVDAALLGSDDTVLEHWDMAALSHLPETAIGNDFAYNKFAPAPYGLAAEVGAMATITLPARDGATPANAARLRLTTVSGTAFEAPISKR
jgi:thiosulfate dehydrogenase [quinone] large subunit